MNPFVIAFRRIIYSIPLKRLLLGLAVFGVLFASFSNAELITTNTTNLNQKFDSYVKTSNSDIMCLVINSCDNWNNASTRFILSTDDLGRGNAIMIKYYNPSINIDLGMGYCTSGGYLLFSSDYKCDVTINEYDITEYSSMQCQTEYNLIPISSVDQNYCTTNNLCPSGGSPSDCPNVGVSNLYINDIFHPGAFNVIMNIPEEIDWDYAYTNSGQNFNIDVVGYNQDFEKIEGWIETNNYKPTSEDFTNIFTSFSSFGGLLIACLFVILVFYFVKKLFK